MISLKKCPYCDGFGSYHPERYSRDKGFFRYAVECPHYVVRGRTRDGADKLWNSKVAKEEARLDRKIRMEALKQKQKDARRWTTTIENRLPCPTCGGLPDINSERRSVSLNTTTIIYYAYCFTCKYGTKECVSYNEAIIMWNEKVREHNGDGK